MNILLIYEENRKLQEIQKLIIVMETMFKVQIHMQQKILFHGNKTQRMFKDC